MTRKTALTVLQITQIIVCCNVCTDGNRVRTEMQVAGNVSNVAKHFVAIVGGTMRYEPVAPASI